MKTAFVFSGEGARGSYQAGIAHSLAMRGVYADRVYGTSSGAINATGYSFLGTKKLFLQWEEINSIGDVFKKNGFSSIWKTGIFNPSPLKKILTNIVEQNPYQIPVTITKVNILTGEVVYVSNTDVSSTEFVDSVVASAAIPGVVEPVDGLWVDGGVKVLAPLKQAIKDGCDNILVIMASPLHIKKLDEVGSICGMGKSVYVAARSLNIAMREMLINDIRLALQRNKIEGYREISLSVFGPKEKIFSMLDFRETKFGAAKGYSEYIEFDLKEL